MGKTRAQIARKHGPAAAGLPATPGEQPPPPRHNGNLILIPAVAAALFLFWYFHLLTLSQMTQLSGGLSMPDMLLGGYDADYIDQLRAAMDTAALGQLSYVHKTAGTLFPLLFGLAWLLLVQLNVSRRWLRWLLWSPVLLFVVVDLWENVAIDSILSGPDAGSVALASALTITRWVLFALSCAAGLTAVLLPRRMRSRS
ncbi:hypothetical protein ASH00_14960 [Arthrobacter sp. Soil782]|uniref:hypothetical protein n=1 Tax=Arthrobacter sp. Soil782 TaxID=1736410 RepID=UPI0006FB3E87|nr:hypothetical protein [Arthrobacter sp. Soil782]KRF03958.1 hypothetical protein ASH00_14960 [Arthrobacter sp. Soil782]